ASRTWKNMKLAKRRQDARGWSTNYSYSFQNDSFPDLKPTYSFRPNLEADYLSGQKSTRNRTLTPYTDSVCETSAQQIVEEEAHEVVEEIECNPDKQWLLCMWLQQALDDKKASHFSNAVKYTTWR
ncbi:hypothetical protein CHS0354_041745, partial [Potamilus streckersoni]